MRLESATPRLRLALAALFLGATAIGFAPIFVRWSEVGPSATAFYRLLFALPVLWLWRALEPRAPERARPPSTRRDFGLLAATGLFFTADLALWHWSLRLTTVANSTLLSNFAPIFVTIGARLFFQERIARRFIAGMFLALAGAMLLVGASVSQGTRPALGDALALATAVSYAGYMLLVKQLRRSFSTATIMAWSGLVACAGFGIIAWLSRETLAPVSPGGWVVLVALALISHVGGQTLITYAFGHLPASFTAISLLWQPVVAALVAWAVLDERLSALQGAGGVVVLAGIALASGSLHRGRRSG